MSGCLFSIFGLKNIETKIQDWKKTYVFLVTERSDRHLASRPVSLNLICCINMSILVNKLQYINSYCQLKYGLLILKSLIATS